MRIINKIAGILVLIGALNWGFVGFFGFDLVAALFGPMTMLSRIIYGAVGVSGLWLVIDYFAEKSK